MNDWFEVSMAEFDHDPEYTGSLNLEVRVRVGVGVRVRVRGKVRVRVRVRVDSEYNGSLNLKTVK